MIMPKVLEVDGYRFFFFSNEGNPQEPCHIHVRKGNGLAKFWIEPNVHLAESIAFSARELRFVEKIINENKEMIRRVWNEFFD